jgi:hypothetical protein
VFGLSRVKNKLETLRLTGSPWPISFIKSLVDTQQVYPYSSSDPSMGRTVVSQILMARLLGDCEFIELKS